MIEAPLSTPAIAIYTTATGEFVVNAPAGAALRAGQSSVPLPAGFNDATFEWSATTKTWSESLAKVKAQLVASTKLTNEGYVRSLYTTNFGKQKKYSRKQAEVMDFRALAPATMTLNSALTVATSVLVPQFNALGVPAQRKKFRFAMAEAAKRGVTVDAVISAWEDTIETIENKVADFEAIEQAAVRAINAATTVAAARAAFAAINWSWRST